MEANLSGRRMTQPDLFALTHAHRGDPETSVDAAIHAKEFASGHCEIIHRVLQHHPHGLTSHEISDLIDIDYYEVARRMSDLQHAGRVEDSGERRMNPSGRMAAVWRAR